MGAKLVLFDDMAPAIDNVDPTIKTEDDLARLKTPDPSNAGHEGGPRAAVARRCRLVGAPVTADFAEAISADGYAENAPEAVVRVGEFDARGGLGEAEFAA